MFDKKQYMQGYNQRPEVKEKRKQYRDNPEYKPQQKERAKRWYNLNKDKVKLRVSMWQKSHPEECNKRNRKYNLKIKIKVLSHYSNGKMECACCGEKHMEFLSINHINGGGNKHRKELGLNAGDHFYGWLIKNNYPEGYDVLCHNCNQARGFYGYCPHEKNKENKLI